MTIRALLIFVQKELQNLYEVNEAKTIVEWLFCDVFSFQNRFALYENMDRLIDDKSKTKIHRKLKRLKQFVPIQYVIHKAWFMDLELMVSPSVLIPRPETEELCLTILKEVTRENVKVIDLATGSGCIAIALKQAKPTWDITATDISAAALKIARCNAIRQKVEIDFVQDDILQSKLIEQIDPVDIIVSNPPYIPIFEKKVMQPNVKNHEPSIALFVPDENPLLFYNVIIQIAEKILKPDGLIFVEMHENFAYDTKKMFESNQWKAKIYNDINQKPRYLKAQKNG